MKTKEKVENAYCFYDDAWIFTWLWISNDLLPFLTLKTLYSFSSLMYVCCIL